MSQLNEVRQAKTLHKAEILAKPNVVGLGVGYKVSARRTTDELSVVVLVRHKVPLVGLSSEALIPQEVGGVRTDVLAVGDLRPLDARTDRWRPAPGGVSLGHYMITAGTLGCIVRDRATGARLILSNNHVLANCNDARIGDPILQPGPVDGGRLDQDVLARLERFIPLQYGLEPGKCLLAKSYARLGNALARLTGSSHRLQVVLARPKSANLVDAAVARLVEDAVAMDQVIEIGVVTGVATANFGMGVRKSGRTTAYTTGEIAVLEATVTVGYGPERSVVFENQIVTSPMSQGGDSGSLLVASDSPKGASPQAVGLLFAGSDLATIHTPIQAVLDSLKVDILNTVTEAAKAAQQAAVQRVQAVKQVYQPMLMSLPNVVGLGVGLRHAGGRRTDEVALVVMVSKKLPADLLTQDDLIPSEIEGVLVDVKEVGQLRVD